MPSRNVLKIDIDEAYYHVYARGNSKQIIFSDAQDYRYFLGLFERYLGPEPARDKAGTLYPHYDGKIELVAYCLMGNHFHLLLWQVQKGEMSKLMRSIMTSYSRYFNLRHKRSGSVFESRYKASNITRDEYLQHISRYIHLNPRYWKLYPYSSLQYYYVEPDSQPTWLVPTRIEEMFEGRGEYATFLKDYEGHKAMLDEIKQDLADQ